ncbi:pheromone-regulated protein prm10 [Coemansia sp. RSA 552]|nr:pheromone-regulated protein prm10 [Coemansia sp. RSA 552]
MVPENGPDKGSEDISAGTTAGHSGSGSSADNGDEQIAGQRQGQGPQASGPQEPRASGPQVPEPVLDTAETPGRPALRLAMMGVDERAAAQRRARANEPATAPVRQMHLELPESGYFAPRGGLTRASSSRPASPFTNPFTGNSADLPQDGDDKSVRSQQRRRRFGSRIPALRFASRVSVHTIHSGTSGEEKDRRATSHLYTPVDGFPERTGGPPAPGMAGGPSEGDPPGLRRRLTQARTGLAGIGRAFNPAAGDGSSSSETEAGTPGSHDTETSMEKLLDKHAANSPDNPPANNTAANNADITSTPDFYPVNPSIQNPGIIHVNMDGHDAARNVVNSILGNVGSSTAQYRHMGRPGASTTPGALEAGMAGIPGMSGPMFPGAENLYPSAGPMGLGQSPTTLRGVYANLNKLQSRMAEHQQKRDQRMREVREREEKRVEKRRREKSYREKLHKVKTDDGVYGGEHQGSVAARIREKIPDKLAGLRLHHAWSHSRPQSPEEQAPEDGEDNKNSFVLRSFHSAPRPESVANYLSTMGTQPTAPRHSAAVPVPRISRTQPPTPGAAPGASVSPGQSPTTSPFTSPAVTPGWEDIMTSSGMLTSGAVSTGAGSRISTISTDSTMAAFENEKQKILAQLADIFNRQNFLLIASRALMAFGAPLHRLEANLIAIALNLDVQATFAVLPGIILITFGDEDTRSSETYVVRIVSGYDMYRLGRSNRTIRRVLKGRISVGQGVKNMERILATPPLYSWWMVIADYVVISFFICPLFWNGSWHDAGVSSMLGLLVGLLQLLAGRFNNYANLFEVSSAFLVSFIAALLQNHICFATVSFAGVAMLLPGLALTTSIIEMASRNMISGTVRLIFAMCRCFMLGYGISVGSMLGSRVLGLDTSVKLLQTGIDSTTDVGNCREGPSQFWWFLFLPAISLAFNVSISAHWRQWPFMMFSGCMAYTVSYFSTKSEAIAPLAPAIAAFSMGIFANVLASFYNHRSAVEPILGGVQLLVPGSLGLKTVLTFITSSGTSSGSFLYNIFSTSLSIAVGLFLSGMVVFPNRKKRVGLMTF